MEEAEKKKKFGIKDIIYLSIIFALTISLFLAIYIPLAKPGITYYGRKCQSFKVQNANLSQGQIVFIGDSITDLYPLDDYYYDLSLATYNRGIGGDVTGGVLNRLQVSLFDLSPSKIVLMIGMNDINGGKTNEQILNNYNQILNQIKTNLPLASVYCMSILPLNEKLLQYVSLDLSVINLRAKNLNDQIQAYAQTLGYNYVDLSSHVQKENGCMDDIFTDDGIHLNANGFALWASILKPIL